MMHEEEVKEYYNIVDESILSGRGKRSYNNGKQLLQDQRYYINIQS